MDVVIQPTGLGSAKSVLNAKNVIAGLDAETSTALRMENDVLSTDSNFNLTDGSWEGGTLNRPEAISLLSFMSQHAECHKDVTFAFSRASGIGQNVVVQCGCGKQSDLTDYESW